MHKCKEKLINFGNPNVILCERGTFFGYQDLVVDFRNLNGLKAQKLNYYGYHTLFTTTITN